MYLVRKLYPEIYEVAKFTDSKEPESVYRVTSKSCSCPARKPCKHQKLVKAFKLLDSPISYFEIDDKDIVRPFTISLLS